MPNMIGQAYGLTVLSPILPGEHEEKLRALLKSYDGESSPFAKVKGKDGLIVHTARWVIVNQIWSEDQVGGETFKRDHLESSYLLLDANVDTDDSVHANILHIHEAEKKRDAFLAEMIKSMPEDIREVYQHCYGFDGVDTFAAYIAHCQIETTFYFVDYAAEARGKVVNVKRALATREDFVALAEKAQSQKPSEVRAAMKALLGGLQWDFPPAPQVKHDADAGEREPSEEDRTLDEKAVLDVQGNVLRGYKLPVARHVFMKVTDAAAARKGLAAVLPFVAHSGEWNERPASAINVAFSHRGLKAIGVRSQYLADFPIAFRMGMRARAEVLGDRGPASGPESWEEAFKGDSLDLLVSIYAKNKNELEKQDAWLKTAFTGVSRVTVQDAATINSEGKFDHEHFGFRDGMGTTDIQGSGVRMTPGSGKLIGERSDSPRQWAGLAPGELLYGYTDEAGEKVTLKSAVDLSHNGTFLVFRKLRENVEVFRDYLAREGKRYPGGEDLLAAKMVGRFRDGTPLAKSDTPDPALVEKTHENNNFTYADDPNGARCPISAHIRRARPRDALGFDGRVTDRRRIQRRGMPYGEWLPPGEKDDGSRGILFLGFNIDIERQFEFIQQQWLNYGNPFRQGNDKDIVSGDHDGTGKSLIQASEKHGPHFCSALPRFVDTRGGEYFFVPGIRALAWISQCA